MTLMLREYQEDSPTTKRCTKCGEGKSLDLFSLDNRSGKVGVGMRRQPICKKCFREYYNSHKTDILSQHRIYRSTPAGKELHNASNRKYQHTELGKLAETKKQYKYNRTEKARLRMRRFNTTPKGRANITRQHHTRRVREKKTECTLTARQWVRILEMQQSKCAVCGKVFSLEDPPTHDHIIPVALGGGLTFGNTQALCRKCNSSKKHRVHIGRAVSELLVGD